MNSLIIYAHPNPLSFNASILKTVQSTLEERGSDIIIRDLNKFFNPILSGEELQSVFTGNGSFDDVTEEQLLVQEADLLIFIYPIWWLGPPAILKGYLDRVLTNGFAFQHTSTGVVPKLTGKKALVIMTGGNSPVDYKRLGLENTPQDSFEKGVLQFVGIETKLLSLLSVPQSSSEERIKFLDLINKQLNHVLNN
ncbi:NAD(P)H-dependent oxidoreductase [Aquiflexum lacus]|uniref:NAD(P)H-dependent oxidoreductase n=1 Tax=Aquiflexum lacus TaxID=2483805 RepID=UPI00189366DD|nr:NAD(P)H-dependent oxidoreductase [Aquiflexum lacus]